MLLTRHRGELSADFRRHYGGTPRALWEQGEHLCDIAAWAAHLGPGTAVHRARNPHHEWDLHAQLQAAAINEQRRLAWLYEWAHSKKKPPQPEWVLPPWESDDRADIERIKGDAFDSVAAAEDWYTTRFPERAAEMRALTQRMTPDS